MTRDSDKIREELEQLERDGVVKPADVVAFARNPDTALHGCFEWNDSEAAERYRLEQARTLIRCYVVVDDARPSEPVRAFVALRSDRKEGGGYRKIAAVLSDDELHAALMRDALVDLRAAQKRYTQLTELKGVFREVERAEKAFEKAQSRGRRKVA